MILDRLEHAHMYRALAVDIARALDFLRQTDCQALADGRHEIDGDRVYAIVQRYLPRPLAEAKWEAHRRYIDVQYVVSGRERMGYAPLRSDLPARQPYDAQKDVVFFDTAGDLLEVPAGSFAIFMPQDIHAPGLASASPEADAQVCKVVLKCRVGD